MTTSAAREASAGTTPPPIINGSSILPRWLIVYDPTSRDFAVIRGSVVIDHVSSYLEGEALRRDFEMFAPIPGETPS